MQSSPDWSQSLAQVSDELLRAALEEAHIPSLLTAMIHLCGNASPLRGSIQPVTIPLAEEEDGLTEDARRTAREYAFAIISAFRDKACQLPPMPSQDVIDEAMQFITGQPVAEDYLEMLREELALFGADGRRLAIDTSALQRGRKFKVLVVGAGMSGILMAIRLKQAGIPFLVVDKNESLGGTWVENTYPGCRVDSPNHLYSYIFAPNDRWPSYFSTRESLYEYFENCVDQHGVRGNIRLGTRVSQANFDESTSTWRVELQDASGRRYTEVSNVLVSATGQLNVPKMPAIRGLEKFQGVSFHSARWEHEHRLAGRRVAVVGTGASATQFVPEIAVAGADITVFQRSPPWLLPTPEYHESVAPGQLWLFHNLPFYAKWYRFFLFRRDGADGILPLLRRDPAWQGRADAISAEHDTLRQAMTGFLQEGLGANPRVLAQSIPDYPPCGKRPLRDDGLWMKTLLRDNVRLVTESICEITATSIVTADGEHHAADVIVYGTGFHADQFLHPMKITGRNGVELHQQWAGDPRAYLGMTVPNFPNFFCVYGPNTNIVIGTSIVFFVECTVRYIMGSLKHLVEDGHLSMECRQDVHDRYNEWIDTANQMMAWGSPNVSSWYKNAAGRVTQNWPGTHCEFWQQTLQPNLADYHLG